MPTLRAALLAAVVACSAVAPAAAQGAPAAAAGAAGLEATHNALRGVLARLVDATNKKDIEALMKELAPDIAFTAINNDTVIGIDNVKPYFDRMLTGASRFLNDFSIKADADQLSKLFAGNQMAISTGTAVGNFDLRGGNQMKFTMPMRWTATLDGSSGQWKLAAIHFSADFAHNPYLSTMMSFWKWLAAGLAVAGLALGFLVGGRRRRAG